MKTTPGIADALTGATRQAASARRNIASHAARAAELRGEPRRTRALAEEEASEAVWQAALVDAERRIAMLEAGQIPDEVVNTQISTYRRQAMTLDPKAKAYWSTPVELTARAFESWCHDRLAAAGRTSQYLVHSVEEGRFANPPWKADIYPAGAERQRINAAFDDLMPLLAAEIRRHHD